MASASRPVVASPTMFRRGSVESKLARPARARSWSSTMTSRFVEPARVALTSGGIRRAVFGADRHIDHDARPGPGPTGHQAATSQQGDTFVHARQAHPLARTVAHHRGRLEAAAPVLDGQTHRGAAARETDQDAGLSGVLAHVAQGLLSD